MPTEVPLIADTAVSLDPVPLDEEAGPWRILLVDDEEGIRDSLSVYLRSAGFDVDTAEDALAARDLLRQQAYDLVLSDISMPEVSGLDLLREIKEMNPAIEVIMITAYLDIALAIQAMRSGAYDFFTKPFSPAELRRRVDKALASS